MKKHILTSLLLMACATLPMTAQTQKQKKDTLAVLTEKAQQGDLVSQNTLGTWYYIGRNVPQSYTEALSWWARAAEKGNSDATANMAMCYQLGHGTAKDSLMATKLYKAAAKRGNKQMIAQHEQIVANTGSTFSSALLYDLYTSGIGVTPDRKKAAAYLTKVADAGNSEAQYKLALHLLNDNQPQEASQWFERASKAGIVGATYYLGWLTYQGMGISQDKQRGTELLKQAADNDFAAAHYRLGLIYLDGNGTEHDDSTAVAHLKKALRTNADARWLLGLCYLNGRGTGQDYYLAAQWMAEAGQSHLEKFNKLLADDNNGPFSQYLLGLRRYFVDKDLDAAMDCFRKVEKAKIAEGKTMQAVIMASKDYPKRNQKKAAKMLQKLVNEKQSTVAAYYLSSMTAAGMGTKKDPAKALQLLRQAAGDNIAYAQLEMADKLFAGDGIGQDYAEAARLYIAVETAGRLSKQGAKNLAELYHKGITTLPDLAKAKERELFLKNYKTNNRLIEMLKTLK